MRSILRRVPGDLPMAYLLLPVLVAGLWPVLWAFVGLMTYPTAAIRWWPVMDGSLLVGLFVALSVWAMGHVRGAWSEGTGAGFPLAALGIACRLWVEFLVHFSVAGDEAIYDAFPGAVSQIVWIHRNLGFVAYAYGLTLVAGSCFLERRLRRRGRDWVFHAGFSGDFQRAPRLRASVSTKRFATRGGSRGRGP